MLATFPVGLLILIPVSGWYCWVWLTDPQRGMKRQARREIRAITRMPRRNSKNKTTEGLTRYFETE